MLSTRGQESVPLGTNVTLPPGELTSQIKQPLPRHRSPLSQVADWDGKLLLWRARGDEKRETKEIRTWAEGSQRGG